MLKKLIYKFRGNLFIYNTIWNIGGKVLQMGLSLIVGMLTARYLGPSNYGVIGYTASYVSFFSVFCQLGFTSIAVKELLENKETEGEVLGTSIFLRVCTSIISTIAITCLVYIMDKGVWANNKTKAVELVSDVCHLLSDNRFNQYSHFQASLVLVSVLLIISSELSVTTKTSAFIIP